MVFVLVDSMATVQDRGERVAAAGCTRVRQEVDRVREPKRGDQQVALGSAPSTEESDPGKGIGSPMPP